MSDEKNLYICFFGDSRLWDNVILSTAYPEGFSYFRPFRYRDAWIHGALIDELVDSDYRKGLIGQEATLAIRFKSEEHKWKIFPLRKIVITGIDYIPDNQSIYFKMGPMLDFRRLEGDLLNNCLEIPQNERNKSSGTELMFYSSASLNAENFVSEEKEVASWVAYCDLIGKDDSLPINPEARSCIFFRFIPPAINESATTGVIHHSKRRGSICGMHLEEGQNYEIVLLHRVPSLIGSHTTVGRVPIEYISQSGNLELSRSEEDYTHNYQTHILTITANRPTGTWEEIIIRPKDQKVTADDNRLINTIKFHIPLKISYSFIYRLKTSYILFIMLWIMLFVSSYLNPLLSESSPASILSVHAIASALVAMLIVFVKR